MPIQFNADGELDLVPPSPVSTGTTTSSDLFDTAGARQMAFDMFHDPTFGDLIRDGVVARTEPGVYDPETQSAPIQTIQSPCRLVWKSITPQQLAPDLVRDATLRFAALGCLDPQDFKIREFDRLTVGVVVYEVVTANDSSAGSGAVWDVTVR